MTRVARAGSVPPARWAPQRRGVAAALALSSLGLLGTPALAGAATSHARRVGFVGHYTGTVALLIDNGTAKISSVKGQGTGTAALVGASTISGAGSAGASALCNPFGGRGTVVGKRGAIRFLVSSSNATGCSSGESGPVTVKFHGSAKAIGGTGVDKGAAGSLAFSGTLKLANTSGSQSGTFTVVLHGTLTVG